MNNGDIKDELILVEALWKLALDDGIGMNDKCIPADRLFSGDGDVR